MYSQGSAPFRWEQLYVSKKLKTSMSWDKTTQYNSEISELIRGIEELGGVIVHPTWSHKTINYFEHPYTVTELGYVSLRGINDYSDPAYFLRRLEYKGRVWLERMERDDDCDSPDYVRSYEFTLETEPEYWRKEVNINEPNSIDFISS